MSKTNFVEKHQSNVNVSPTALQSHLYATDILTGSSKPLELPLAYQIKYDKKKTAIINTNFKVIF